MVAEINRLLYASAVGFISKPTGGAMSDAADHTTSTAAHSGNATPAASIPGLEAAPPPSSRGVSEPYQQLVLDHDGPCATVTLNRPEVHNALSMQLSNELIDALERLRDSDMVKVVVIQGAGRSFCAGDDITEMLGWGNANGIMRRVAGYQRMANTLEELDKVTIAAVDGPAVGGGLEITMVCDFVIATERSRWGMPE